MLSEIVFLKKKKKTERKVTDFLKWDKLEDLNYCMQRGKDQIVTSPQVKSMINWLAWVGPSNISS